MFPYIASIGLTAFLVFAAGPALAQFTEVAADQAASFAEIHSALSSFVKNDSEQEKDWWHDAKRGWFYFEKMPEAEEEKPKDLMKDLDWARIRMLPAPRMRKLLDELLDYAVSYPTRGNVRAYMTGQYIATERSVAFMDAWQSVIRDHPSLDETVKRPPSAFVSWQLQGAENRAYETLVREMAGDPDVGLILFYSDECYFCSLQHPLFKQFVENTGWTTVEYVNVRERPDLATKFRLETVPEIWLAVKDKGFRRVTAGLRTLDVIKKNVVPAYGNITGKNLVPKPYKLTVTPDEPTF